MKKIVLFFVALFLVNSAFALNFILVNSNDKFDMVVTYYISQHWTASGPFTATIKAKKTATDKNYITISSDINSMIEIISAVEKDEMGNVISSGTFSDTAGYNTGCKALNNSLNNNENKIIAFDDMKQSPYIMCVQSYPDNYSN